MRAFLCVLCCAVAVDAAPPKKTTTRAFSSLSVNKEGQPLPAGKVNLLGNLIPRDQFCQKCIQKDARALQAGAFDWRAVKVVGPIAEITEGEDGGWSVYSRFDKVKNQWTDPVTMTLAEIGGNEGAESSGFRVGNMVCAYGVCVPETKGGMSVWFAELLPPGVKWDTKLVTPPTIVAGTNQTYTVNCVVKNTGAQVLRNVEFSVRLKQVDSPNDQVKTYTIPALAPGETAPFSIDFDWYNYKVIGKTSVPIGVAKVTAYEL